MLSDVIDEILEQRGINVTQLARETGINRQTIQAWYEGKVPGVDKIITLSKYLHVSTDYLLEVDYAGTEQPEREHYSKEEKKLIKNFRDADDRGKEIIKEIAKNEAQRNAANKKEEESQSLKIG